MMKLKKISEQVMVITGASSGIGLATAKLAAGRGAKVVLSARDQDGLIVACDEIRAKGGIAEYCVADVANLDDMQRLCNFAVEKFGGFDTWVNNAGLSIYGKLTETHLTEKRRVFDVNFWGVVHGTKVALPILKRRGGALINMGSVVSEYAMPLQGIYSASKHAVKAYTDALRRELEIEDAPVAVTLIKPSAIDTPYVEHAANKLDAFPKNPPPVYSANVVADAVVNCAEHYHRDIAVGAAKLFGIIDVLAPRILDYFFSKSPYDMYKMQESGDPKRPDDSLYHPSGSKARVDGGYKGHVAKTSVLAKAQLHPVFSTLAMVGAGVLAYAGLTLYGYGRSRAQRQPPVRGVLVDEEMYDDVAKSRRDTIPPDETLLI